MTLQGVDPMVSINGRVIDPWQVLVPLVIRFGRTSPNSQPDANTCSFGIYGQLPFEVRMNSPVEVTLAWGGGGLWEDIWEDVWSDTIVDGDPAEKLTRFVGRVTDLNPLSEHGVVQTEVVASGRMSDLGRVKSGWYKFPEETEDARLLRLSTEAAEAGIDLGGEGYNWMMAAREIETASVLDILYDTATAGGIVHETVEGVTQFQHWAARQDVEPVAWLNPSDIEDSVGWSQQIDAFVKRAVVRYGTPAAGNSEQPQVTVGVRGWGMPETVISTFLKNASDATDFGTLVMNRWGDPNAFEAPVLNVVAAYVEPDTWDTVMGLSFGDVIVVEGVTPSPAPLPQGSNEWFVEGWSEEYDKEGHGRVNHRVALSVSDRHRFRPDIGDDVNIMDIVVDPVTAPYGTVRQVTATLMSVYGETVTAGLTRLLNGTEELARQKNPNPDGSVAFSLEGDALQYGTHVLTIAYSGWWPEWLSAVAECPAITVYDPSQPGDPPLASVSLTVSPAELNQGQVVTATATIGMTQSASKAGVVKFDVSRDGGTTWSNFASVTTKAATDKAVGKWTSTDGTKTAHIRARFDPTLAGVATATSTSKAVDVKTKTERTIGYTADWTQAYKGNGSKIDTVMRFGYKNSADGNKKSLAGFPVPEGAWSGWTISKVEVYLNVPWWQSNSGTMRIGSHQHASAPTSSPKVDAARTTVSNWKEVAKWVNVTSWGKGLATGSLKGIVCGPGSNNNAVYSGYAQGVPSAGAPQLRVTGYRWE